MRMLLLIMLLIVTFSPSGNARDPVRTRSSMVSFLKEYLHIKYERHRFDQLIYVAVKQQKLFMIEGEQVVAEFDVSTARNGLGGQIGSQKTPPGLHIVKEKVGENVPVGGIIREKVYTGETANIERGAVRVSGDFITTRLFHLAGMEPGVNRDGEKDSYRRGIMIHGTPEEGLIGQPVSHGCIRMTNADVLTLFSMVDSGTYVVILNN